MPGVFLWGWDSTNSKWVKLAVDANGLVKVDMSDIDLDDLNDVSVAAPADDDLFYYDDATGLWKSRKLVDADIPAAIARDAEVTAAVSDHAALTITHGTVDDIADQTDIATHAALTTGIHGLGISCRVHHSVAQTISTDTITTLAFDSEAWDTDTMHDNTTNNSRITFKTAGKYLLGLSVTWIANATGERLFEIYKNGQPLLFTGSQAPTDAINRTNQTGISIAEFVVNDYIEAKVRQRSGGNLNVDKFYSASPVFWAVCIEKA